MNVAYIAIDLENLEMPGEGDRVRVLPRSAAGWTIAVFGIMAVVFGIVGLVSPDTTLAGLGFRTLSPDERAPGDYTRVYVAASSMASLNMGVYYLVATYTEWRPFFRFTVPFRLLTFAVFSTLVLLDVAPGRFLAVAAWEGIGAVATGVALLHDARRAARRPA